MGNKNSGRKPIISSIRMTRAYINWLQKRKRKNESLEQLIKRLIKQNENKNENER